VEVLIILPQVVVEAVASMRQLPELLKQEVREVLLEALQLPQVVVVQVVRQLVRQELLAQQVQLSLVAQVAVVVEQTMQVLAALVVQGVSPVVAVEVAVVAHPQAVLVAMVRLVV
jgi:hypothetical protein